MAQSIPTTSSMGGASTASFIPNIANDLRITDETSSGAQNDLIQVTRNGCIFFVHRTQAMAEQFTDRTLPNLEKSHSNVTTLLKNTQSCVLPINSDLLRFITAGPTKCCTCSW